MADTSLFAQHLLPCLHTEAVLRHTPETVQIGWIIILSFVLFGCLVYRYTDRLPDLIRSVFGFRNLTKKSKEKFRTDSLNAILFTLLIGIFYGLLFYQLSYLSIWGTLYFLQPPFPQGIVLLQYCILFVFAFIALNVLLANLFGIIVKESPSPYLQTALSFGVFSALIGFPFLLLSLESGLTDQKIFIINSVFIICLILFLLKFFKMLFCKLWTSKFSYIHIFLYLCAFEILLFFISWKAFWMLFKE